MNFIQYVFSRMPLLKGKYTLKQRNAFTIRSRECWCLCKALRAVPTMGGGGGEGEDGTLHQEAKFFWSNEISLVRRRRKQAP